MVGFCSSLHPVVSKSEFCVSVLSDYSLHEAIWDRDVQSGSWEHGSLLEGLLRGVHAQSAPQGPRERREQDTLSGTKTSTRTYTTVQKFGVSNMVFVFERNNNFIQQGCIKFFKSDSKDIYNVTNDFNFRLMLFFWTSYNPEKKLSCFPQKYEAAQLFSSLIIRNVSWAENQHIMNDFWRIIWHWRLE